MFKCCVCGNTSANEETLSEVFNVEGRRVLVENIPAQVCARCGDTTFSRETTERIRTLVRNSHTTRTVQLDVLELVP